MTIKQLKSLSNIEIGLKATVASVYSLRRDYAVRLLEMGFIPGADVVVYTRSGGLTLVGLDEQRIALSDEEARYVSVTIEVEK